MTELKFAEEEACYSQQTLVKMLSDSNYKFVPISDYGNDQFYCYVEYRELNSVKDFLTRLGFNVKYKTYFGKLGLIMSGKFRDTVEPIVFTRDDVKRVLMDVPDTYVGPRVL